MAKIGAAELGRYLDEARRALEAEDVAAAERALAVAARIDADAPELSELRREFAALEAVPRPAPGPPTSGGARTISFSEADQSAILSGDEFSDAGIRSIRAAPIGYCGDAEPAMLAAGTHQAPVSFLSTAERGDLRRCNAVPLRFDLRRPARAVTVDFYGAATDYFLTGYDASGRAVVRAAAQGNPYVSAKPYRVRIATDRADIAAFEFGQKAALTMIGAIELEY